MPNFWAGCIIRKGFDHWDVNEFCLRNIHWLKTREVQVSMPHDSIVLHGSHFFCSRVGCQLHMCAESKFYFAQLAPQNSKSKFTRTSWRSVRLFVLPLQLKTTSAFIQKEQRHWTRWPSNLSIITPCNLSWSRQSLSFLFPQDNCLLKLRLKIPLVILHKFDPEWGAAWFIGGRLDAWTLRSGSWIWVRLIQSRSRSAPGGLINLQRAASRASLFCHCKENFTKSCYISWFWSSRRKSFVQFFACKDENTETIALFTSRIKNLNTADTRNTIPIAGQTKTNCLWKQQNELHFGDFFESWSTWLQIFTTTAPSFLFSGNISGLRCKQKHKKNPRGEGGNLGGE